LKNDMDLTPTPSQTVGPFFHFSLTSDKQSVRRVAGPQAEGERVWLSCRVFDGEGNPVNDAMIEIWQADHEGRYHSTGENEGQAARSDFFGFGRMPTGKDGACEFETIKPGRALGPGNVRQAPHFVVAVFARGLLKQLFTRIYFAGDDANQADPVLALVPEERRDTLMAHPDSGRPGHWLFNVHLQGEQETVFFDV
jgi:protocatechuate 3,4-dioxygenase, alpha subunit